MTVTDLIELLKEQDPKARVVLYDHTASIQPAVSSLGVGDVQPIALRGEEVPGVVRLNVVVQGPANAVVLGPQFPCPSLADSKLGEGYESLKVQTQEEFFKETAQAVEDLRAGRRTTPLSTISFESEEVKQEWIAQQNTGRQLSSSEESFNSARSIMEMSRADLEALIQDGEDSDMTERLRELMAFADKHRDLIESGMPPPQCKQRRGAIAIPVIAILTAVAVVSGVIAILYEGLRR